MVYCKDDVLDFSEQLENLIQNRSLRERLSSNALNSVQYYSADNVSEQVLELYEVLLAGKYNRPDPIINHF